MAWPIITDQQRDLLLREPKPVVANRWDHVVWTQVSSSRGANQTARLRITGELGSRFHVSWRQSLRSPRNFCILLRYYVAKKSTVNLIRCCGCHDEHENTLERDAGLPHGTIPRDTPHVHIITERYQHAALVSPRRRDDQYAEPAVDQYASFNEAFHFFWEAFNFYRDTDEGRNERQQPSLFPLKFSVDTFHA